MSNKRAILALPYLLVALFAAGCVNSQLATVEGAAALQGEAVVEVTIRPDRIKRAIPRSFMGINLSYFNDTDDIWSDHAIEDKLRRAGIGSLRYPGGEETSFYHWRQPGVNGYEDIHDDPAVHGNPRNRGPFQVTWVAPEAWDRNTRFMSFDDFMARCRSLGAEPIVGLNLSCGRAHDRREAGLEEALLWMRYCKEKGYEVTYWFLDNEPWHFHAAYTFSIDEYAEDVVYYGEAIKKEFPNVMLIVNPGSSETINHADQVRRFIEKAGGVIDFIDIHWYWSWGSSSWDKWLTQTPMRSGDKWKDAWMDRPYAQDVKMIRGLCEEAGYPDIGVTVLEWNVGPSEQTRDLSDPAYALIQAQMLMEFLDADVEMTCLWTLLWQSRREVWPVQDRFQSIVTHDPPHTPTATLEVMRLFSSLVDSDQVTAEASADKLLVVAADRQRDNTLSILLLNKDEGKRNLKIHIDPQVVPAGIEAEYVDYKKNVAVTLSVTQMSENMMRVMVEPFSLTSVRVRYID